MFVLELLKLSEFFWNFLSFSSIFYEFLKFSGHRKYPLFSFPFSPNSFPYLGRWPLFFFFSAGPNPLSLCFRPRPAQLLSLSLFFSFPSPFLSPTGGARPSVRERGWKKKRKKREAGWAEVGRMEGE